MSKHLDLKNCCDGESHIVSDDTFQNTLRKFIQLEKEHLPTSEKGPDEQRYVIYSSAFDKVTVHRTTHVVWVNMGYVW